MDERRALNMPPNALFPPKKGGMITKIAGMVIKLCNRKSSVIPASVPRIMQMKSIGMLSIRMRLTAVLLVFRPFTRQKTATKANKTDNMLTGDNQPQKNHRVLSRFKLDNKIAARNKEGMVIMSPAEVIIGEEILSKSQFLR